MLIRALLGRLLLGWSLLALVVGLAVAVPSGGAADGPYLNVWVHYDYMVGPDGSFAPSASAMQTVVDAFAAHGVTLHIDPQHTAIPERRVIVPDWPSEYSRAPGFDDPACTGPDAVRFSALRAQYFQPSSNHPWHYAVFGNYVYTDATAHANNCPATEETGGTPPLFGMTGDAEVGFLDVPGGFGYDFVVTFGAYHLAGVPVPDRTVAGVFMHELGHNLGLQHGGAPARPNDYQDNYKPNYLSVMNYDFTNTGIPYAAQPGSTAIAGYRVDYSDVKLPDLDERSLDETVGVQDSAHPTDITYSCADPFCSTPIPAFGPVDWNGNGTTTDTHVVSDLNSDLDQPPNQPVPTQQILHGSDDWAWIHARLIPPTVTGFCPTTVAPGQGMVIAGSNLYAPNTVIFGGGATATGSANGGTVPPIACDAFGPGFGVTVPPGAKSGPISVVTSEAKATSSQYLTITP
jgi:peptidase M66-like protein